jgi:acyl-CoA thioester hydrolase
LEMTTMNKDNKKSFEIRRNVPFYDLDPMQIVWHGNYFNYFEDARRALLDHLGIDLYAYYEKTKIIFPIIRTATKHISPLRYRDEFICKATMVEARFKIVVDFEIRLAEDGKICTRGRTEQVAVQSPEMEILLRIPDEIQAALGS